MAGPTDPTLEPELGFGPDEPTAAEHTNGAPSEQNRPAPKRQRIDGTPWARGDHVEIAIHALAQLEGGGPALVFDDGALYRYDPQSGIWKPIGDAEVSCAIQAFAGVELIDGRTKTLLIKSSDVSGARNLARDRVSKHGFFADAPRGFMFSNGFVQVTAERITVQERSESHRARFSYPFAYQENPAMRWLKFLGDIFRDDDDRTDKIQLLHEFIGGALLGISTLYDQCVVMHGTGDDGKSTLLDVLHECMPPGTCAAVPPQKMSGPSDSSDYFRAQLAGKLLNIVSELPESDIMESTGFKAIVSGDIVNARHPAGRAFSFAPRAAHIFAANKLPATNDQTPGFWRRFIVVPFHRSFTGDPDRDPNIARKILAAELPAIVAAMLKAGQSLLKTGAYTVPASHAKALREWQLRADTVRQFLEERTKPWAGDIKNGIRASALYEAYKRWATDSGHKRPLARNSFGERTALAGYHPKHTESGSRYPLQLNGPDEP
jgi:P4 family phage/plasmid primase-like protien